MGKEKVDALVVCSTLNQITNYLVIKKYVKECDNKDFKIYNITFSKEAKSVMNDSIKIKKWDEQLKGVFESKLENEKYSIENIELEEKAFYDIQKIIKAIEGKIKKGDIVHWHVTGGQRIVSTAISQFIKDRKNDKFLYVEGNIEQLLMYDNELRKLKLVEYADKGDNRLNLKEALMLAGFDYKDGNGRTMKIYGDEKEYKERDFYNKLYYIFIEGNKEYEDISGSRCTFREVFLNSNKEKDQEKRKSIIKKLFEDLEKTNKDIRNIEYKILESEEYKKSFPGGYIFEKIVAHKLYSLLKSEYKSKYINEIGLSVKVHFSNKESSDSTIDELDIVLLSNTGKIFNIECKTGGMEGDNAKSHNYTTYRLSGVFGMPILISPLLAEERDDTDKLGKWENQGKAIRSAERAQLSIWCINELEDMLKEFLIGKER